jgi:hypothetical protein
VKIPCIPANVEGRLALDLNRLPQDQRTTAERKWAAPMKPAAPQRPCDHGLFGDSHLQADLVEQARRKG